jgi:hypothetical protein
MLVQSSTVIRYWDLSSLTKTITRTRNQSAEVNVCQDLIRSQEPRTLRHLIFHSMIMLGTDGSQMILHMCIINLALSALYWRFLIRERDISKCG